MIFRLHIGRKIINKYTGRWQNDIKEATVKCKAEYGITRIEGVKL
jgi:hypothetical protein